MTADEPPALLGRWARVSLAVAVAIVLYTDLSRYVDPVGEKYVNLFPPGAADFYFPFAGAKALTMGVNPYQHNVPALFDPWHRDEIIDGVVFRQLYPPTHLLLYLPLVWLSGGDTRVASRIWFHTNLVALVVLAGLTCALLVPILGSRRRVFGKLLVPVLVVFSLSVGVAFALERGQSDIFSALLCWSAVTLVLRRNLAPAMFLATWAALLKGYPILLAGGLGLLGLTAKPDARVKRPWLSTIAGGAIAIAIMLLPVAKYLRLASIATRYRSQMFWNEWLNHSFRNLAYNLSPGWAEPGRLILTGLGVLAALLCWLEAWKLLRDERATPADRTLWVCLFATCALSTMIGYSALSCPYNLVIILPGVLIFALAQERVAMRARVPTTALGLGVVAIVACLFLFRYTSPKISLASWGIAGTIALLGTSALRALRNPRRPASEAGK